VPTARADGGSHAGREQPPHRDREHRARFPQFGTIIFRITDVDPKTGRVLRVFEKRYRGNPYLTQVQCNILLFAPTGLHVLAECPQFGRLDGSAFTPLPSGSSSLPNAPAMDAAW
jgi:hypothetical protein